LYKNKTGIEFVNTEIDIKEEEELIKEKDLNCDIKSSHDLKSSHEKSIRSSNQS